VRQLGGTPRVGYSAARVWTHSSSPSDRRDGFVATGGATTRALPAPVSSKLVHERERGAHEGHLA
jgi:hypothetical protein